MEWNVCVFSLFSDLSFLDLFTHFALLFYFSQSWPLFTLDTRRTFNDCNSHEKIKLHQFLLPFYLSSSLSFIRLSNSTLLEFYPYRITRIYFFTYFFVSTIIFIPPSVINGSRIDFFLLSLIGLSFLYLSVVSLILYLNRIRFEIRIVSGMSTI